MSLPSILLRGLPLKWGSIFVSMMCTLVFHVFRLRRGLMPSVYSSWNISNGMVGDPLLRARKLRSQSCAIFWPENPRLVFLRRLLCQSTYQHCTIYVPRFASLLAATAVFSLCLWSGEKPLFKELCINLAWNDKKFDAFKFFVEFTDDLIGVGPANLQGCLQPPPLRLILLTPYASLY